MMLSLGTKTGAPLLMISHGEVLALPPQGLASLGGRLALPVQGVASLAGLPCLPARGGASFIGGGTLPYRPKRLASLEGAGIS